MSIYSNEESSSRVTVLLVATDVDLIHRNLFCQALLYDKLGRWFSRDSALNWKLLEASKH
jgi:hypothetical protein